MSGFYHNNVFSSRLFTRSTKENFNSFILGEQGVQKAQDIAVHKQNKRAFTTELNRLKRDVFGSIQDLDNFLSLVPVKTQIEYSSELEDVIIDEKKKAKLKSKVNEINKRETFKSIYMQFNFDETILKLNSCLAKSLSSHHASARLELENHIKKNFNNVDNAENWIREGLVQKKDENCPFCGQFFNPSANNLFEIYEKSFDNSFNDHDEFIKSELSEIEAKLENISLTPLSTKLVLIQKLLLSYPELNEDNDFVEIKNNIESNIQIITGMIEEWESTSKTIGLKIKESIRLKYLSPNKKIECLDLQDNLKQYNDISDKISELNDIGLTLNNKITNFKNTLIHSNLEEEIEANQNKQDELKLIIKRIELSEQCNSYITLTNNIQHETEIIPRLQDELNIEQSQFLNEYFNRLNTYFREFGSNDFLLILGTDNSGHIPIYYLKIKFKNEDISENALDKVFSESDRRALALAIFWAQISGFSNNIKENLIVVLDDPVTSFDNNRISTVHRKIIDLSNEVKQLIILSHYEQEVSKFLISYRNRDRNIQLFEINLLNNFSVLESGDPDFFIKTEHEKSREKIFQFISGITNEFNTDLRVFFEYEISLRFAKQIKDKNINEFMLSNRIDKLYSEGIITERIKNQCHNWRESLNPEHHTWTGNNIEDKRNTANLFIEFVYNELFPA